MSKQDKRFRFINGPAALAVIVFLMISAAFAWQMFLQFKALNYGVQSQTFSMMEEHFTDTVVVSTLDAARIALEFDAQTLRTTRAQSLVASHLFIQTLALISGLALIVMGSAFVFARIESKTPTTGDGTVGNKTLKVSTTMPGLVLAGFGSLVIAATQYAATQYTIETNDGAIYLTTHSLPSIQSSPEQIEKSAKDVEAMYLASIKSEAK